MRRNYGQADVVSKIESAISIILIRTTNLALKETGAKAIEAIKASGRGQERDATMRRSGSGALIAAVRYPPTQMVSGRISVTIVPVASGASIWTTSPATGHPTVMAAWNRLRYGRVPAAIGRLSTAVAPAAN
jgi:hypothetical protein